MRSRCSPPAPRKSEAHKLRVPFQQHAQRLAGPVPQQVEGVALESDQEVVWEVSAVEGEVEPPPHLEEPAPAVTLDARYVWLSDSVFTTVRAHWQKSS